MLRRKKQIGQSVMEYLVLTIFILGAFLVFQKYIVRAISGRWKMVGDSWGSGRVYDPQKTEECIFDYRFTDKWYTQDCYDKSDCACEDAIGVSAFYGYTCSNYSNPATCGRGWQAYGDCEQCVRDCVDASPMCN